MFSNATLNAAQTTKTTLHELAIDLERAVANATAGTLPDAVGAVLRDHQDIEDLLTPEQSAGSSDRYTRHILYADPAGRFTLVALVWRPGQFTPVHGHYTWCAYSILRGSMHEEQFGWDVKLQRAIYTDNVKRITGDVVSSHAGLHDIHRLNNKGDEIAISIHVYGVDGDRVSTHVNRIIDIA